MRQASEAFLQLMQRRRTVRDYATREVPREVLENALLAAGTALFLEIQVRSPHDPDKHVWIMDHGRQQVMKSTNDGKRMVMAIGVAGAAIIPGGGPRQAHLALICSGNGG